MLSSLTALAGPALATAASTRGATARSTPGRAYVTDLFASTVSVVDLATNTVTATVLVEGGTTMAAASPDGTTVYVVLQDAGAIAVFDTATNTVTNTITVGTLPSGVAFTPDGSKAYVPNGESSDISVIDTASQTVSATIPSPEGSFPFSVAVSPNGATAYVVNTGNGTVSVIDTATNVITATIAVGDGPYGVVVLPNGTRAYVSNQFTNDVSVIDTATNTVIATIPVGPNARGIDTSPDGSTIYVSSADNYRMSVINTASNMVTVTVPSAGQGIALRATSTRVYLTNFDPHVTVVDRATNVVIADITFAGDPDGFGVATWGLAIIPGDTPVPGATPTITTQASPGNLEGAVVNDTATLSGGAAPTGQVIFRLYSDPDCLTPVFSSTKPLVGSTATSDNFTPQPGTYYWRAVYTGDANNNPAANACQAPHETVVISPFAPPPFTRTITGDFAGPLTVNAGDSVQLLNARVAGPVTVNPGGKLTVINSQIARGIVATSPGFLSICGSQVSGPSPGQALGVFNATVPVRIGDAARNCAGNRFAGNVNLIGNGTQTLGNNVIFGNATVNNGGPGQTLVKNNNVSGLLACSGNAPPPTATRVQQRNTAGSRSGQCAGTL